MEPNKENVETMPDTKGVMETPAVKQVSKNHAHGLDPVSFEPVGVCCPVCATDDTTKEKINLCAKCGAWFVVEPGGEE